jgi:hypothetical protein
VKDKLPPLLQRPCQSMSKFVNALPINMIHTYEVSRVLALCARVGKKHSREWDDWRCSADLSDRHAPPGRYGVRSRSSGGAIAVVRQLNTIVRTRNPEVITIARIAARVAGKRNTAVRNTNDTAPATAVST